MKKILCTFPGKFGDLLWALPTVRAIAEANGGPVGLLISSEYYTLLPLITQQPYIDAVWGSEEWVLQQTAPITPWQPPDTTWLRSVYERYDQVIHLGYRSWPSAPLPLYTWEIAQDYGKTGMVELRRPWISVAEPMPLRRGLAVGFSDEWFELKYGITELLDRDPTIPALHDCVAPKGRWAQEAQRRTHNWASAAWLINSCELFLGCCSALHVLAVATGTTAILVEPNKDRWNPIFWPLGMDGPEVTVVRGGDGLPTFDARHTIELIRSRMEGRG